MCPHCKMDCVISMCRGLRNLDDDNNPGTICSIYEVIYASTQSTYMTMQLSIHISIHETTHASIRTRHRTSFLIPISIHEATQASTIIDCFWIHAQEFQSTRLRKPRLKYQKHQCPVQEISIHEATQASTAKPCKKITQYTFKTINFLQTTILHPIINFKNNYVHKNFSTFFGANPPVFSCALDIRTQDYYVL